MAAIQAEAGETGRPSAPVFYRIGQFSPERAPWRARYLNLTARNGGW